MAVRVYQNRKQNLAYLKRLARDERLSHVYGYFIGSGFNAISSNTLKPEQPTSPA